MTAPLQRPLAPGTALLPGYTVISLLSRGNRLDVYDAWSKTRRCRCIVKLARPDSCHEPDLLSRLDHPHWVRLYEVVASPETALVLETLTGATLAAVLDRTRRLRAADAMILGAQVASGLSYLHEHGRLHLDLTPGNIVVAGRRAILIDLSLAAGPGRGRVGAGTTGYRAPEQLRGQVLTTATDVWALGMVLHEALSGVQPGETNRLNDVVPLRRRQRLRVLPGELVELVNTCLADDPADRPTLDTILAKLSPDPPMVQGPPGSSAQVAAPV
jgi:serine/threonine protein kinase